MERGSNEPWMREARLVYPDGHKDILYENNQESLISNNEIVKIISNNLTKLNMHPQIAIEDALVNMKLTTYDINGNIINKDMAIDPKSFPIDELKMIANRNQNESQKLDKIKNDIILARQKKQEITNLNYQDYQSEIDCKNAIIEVHNKCIKYADSKGIQFWKSYNDSGIYYRINFFAQTKKYNKNDDFYAFLNTHIKIYDTLEDVQLLDNSLLLIVNYLSIVKDEIFDPWNNLEWVLYNNMEYKNTFQYTSFLKKRNIQQEKLQLEQQLSQAQYFAYPQPPNIIQPGQMTTQQQVLQLIHPFKSIQNHPILSILPVQDKLQQMSEQLEIKNSIIKDFISYLAKNEYQYKYIMNWLANFFQTLNKSALAIILIGDNKTTDILINKIIKPVFAYKKEYFSVVNEETLKKANDIIIKDKIFYHIDTDNLSKNNIKSPQLSNLLLELIKPNSLGFVQAIENNETYIHGETIVTSSNESPYLFLKNSYSRCSVFSVVHIDTILKKMDLDLLQLVEFIESDLDNFSNILAQYQTDNHYYRIAQTDKKDVLSKMKKGVLLTPDLEEKILLFINAIKRKDVVYFKKLEQEDDKNLYKELVENFDNDDAIYQSLLNKYFNVIHEDIIFSDNSYFIEILKERECLFNQTPDDNSKLNNQKIYKLYKYKLGKSYKGNCQDTL